MDLFSRLIEFVYPTHCLVCRHSGAVVHARCYDHLPYLREPFCHQCARPLTERACHSYFCRLPDRERFLTGIRSVFLHEAGAREAVLRLKYRGVSSLQKWAGSEVAAGLTRFGLEGYFEMVVPVPLHRRRLQERGYNQAALVASALAHKTGQLYDPHNLIRPKDTRSQVNLNRPQRAANVQGAFAWKGSTLPGRKVLLLDDVCTTGATLNECARALKEGGADEVWAITLTRELLKPAADTTTAGDD